MQLIETHATIWYRHMHWSMISSEGFPRQTHSGVRHSTDRDTCNNMIQTRIMINSFKRGIPKADAHLQMNRNTPKVRATKHAAEIDFTKVHEIRKFLDSPSPPLIGCMSSGLANMSKIHMFGLRAKIRRVHVHMWHPAGGTLVFQRYSRAYLLYLMLKNMYCMMWQGCPRQTCGWQDTGVPRTWNMYCTIICIIQYDRDSRGRHPAGGTLVSQGYGG